MRKIRPDATEVLNRLFQIVTRSLPMYLAGADPWTKSSDEPATKALERIVADAKFYSSRLAEMILEYRGRIDQGDFPMEFTELNMLSLDYLVKELPQYLRSDLAEIQRCIDDLRDDIGARVLAEELLGNTRGHLETLEELAKQPHTIRIAS